MGELQDFLAQEKARLDAEGMSGGGGGSPTIQGQVPSGPTLLDYLTQGIGAIKGFLASGAGSSPDTEPMDPFFIKNVPQPTTATPIPSASIPVPTPIVSTPVVTKPTIIPTTGVTPPTIPIPSETVPPVEEVSTPPTTGAPILEEAPTKYPPFEAPTPPEEIDVKGEINKMISGLPRTAEEFVGKPRRTAVEEFANLPWYERLARGAVMAGQRKDFDTEIDKVQKQFDDRFEQDFQAAKHYMNAKSQLELRNIEFDQKKNDEKREGYLKMWSALGESHPERFMSDPNWWKMGMRAYGMSEDSLRKFVASAYDSSTGKYNLYMPKWKQDWEGKKSLATELSKLFPGMDSQDYVRIAMNGKWPEWVGNKEEELKREFMNPATSPMRKEQIQKTLSEIDNIKDYVSPDSYAKLEKARKAGMDPQTYKDLKQMLDLKRIVGSHMAESWMKSIEARRLALAMKETNTKSPSQGEINQFNLAGTLNSPTAQVMLAMNPSFRMMTGNKELTDKFGTQYGYFDELLGRVSGGGAFKNNQEKQDLNQYFMYQRKLLSSRGYGKIVNIAKLSVFEAQKAIEWAMKGVSPDDIEQAILKSRQGQKK